MHQFPEKTFVNLSKLFAKYVELSYLSLDSIGFPLKNQLAGAVWS
jgi:hypothetical protein